MSARVMASCRLQRAASVTPPRGEKARAADKGQRRELEYLGQARACFCIPGFLSVAYKAPYRPLCHLGCGLHFLCSWLSGTAAGPFT
ncbi:hypothetical protein ES703_58727 [subsurface metagenome]